MPIDSSLPRVGFERVAVARNSAMYELITNTSPSNASEAKRKARDHFNACARDAARLSGVASYYAYDGTLMETATGKRSVFDDVDA